jgi:hypothetical protein
MHRALTRCAEELGANQFDAMQNWRLQLNSDCNEDDDMKCHHPCMKTLIVLWHNLKTKFEFETW